MRQNLFFFFFLPLFTPLQAAGTTTEENSFIIVSRAAISQIAYEASLVRYLIFGESTVLRLPPNEIANNCVRAMIPKEMREKFPPGLNKLIYKFCFSKGSFNKYGFHSETGENLYTSSKYSKDGYDIFGYDKDGYDRRGYDITGVPRDKRRRNDSRAGYNKFGYDKEGYDRGGYNKKGYNRSGYDKYGYNKYGLNKFRFYKKRVPSFSFLVIYSFKFLFAWGIFRFVRYLRGPTAIRRIETPPRTPWEHLIHPRAKSLHPTILIPLTIIGAILYLKNMKIAINNGTWQF